MIQFNQVVAGIYNLYALIDMVVVLVVNLLIEHFANNGGQVLLHFYPIAKVYHIILHETDTQINIFQHIHAIQCIRIDY